MWNLQFTTRQIHPQMPSLSIMLLLQLLMVWGHRSSERVDRIGGQSSAESFQVPALASSEYVALYSLYNATHGISWIWNNSVAAGIQWDFCGSSDPCIDHWQGVSCTVVSSTSHVTDLNLESHNLNGTLPSSIDQLYALNVLVLSDNHIVGTIPAEVGGLLKLQHVDLSLNALTGSMPYALGQCALLQYVDLSANYLTGSITPSFANLCSLQYWSMHTNRINGTIPNVFTCMHDLRMLNMHYNKLSGHIPLAVSLLYNLITLALDTNELSGPIPSNIGNLTKLENLFLFTNKLSGPIPTTIDKMQNLQMLYISDNRLTGHIPSGVGKLHKLYYFNVLDNFLSGTLPASLGNLVLMKQFLVYHNLLTGTIPASYGNFTSILLLMLSSNHISGSLPSSIGQLGLVEYFDCGSNRLTGTIPDTVGGMVQMKFLYLYQNHLSGSIPASMGSLWRLQEMKLLFNLLEGSVPCTLQNMANLTVLLLYNNHLTGTLDGVFNASVQTLLNTVQISTNRFTGTLPEELFRLPALLTVAAVSNCFSGSLPDNICDAVTAHTIALDGLRSAPNCQSKLLPGISSAYKVIDPWRGTIPVCLFCMPSLTTLHLSGNGYTGSLPEGLNISASLVGLSLSHNALTGTIPRVMQDRVWSNLDLSYNRLSGTLSSSFASALANNTALQASVALSLDNNRLSGRIPAMVATIHNISVLTSNVFTCRLDRSDLPQHDDDVSNYQCGSSSFNAPFFIWFGCAIFAGVGLACYLAGALTNTRFPHTFTALSRVHKWLNATDSSMAIYTQFVRNLQQLVVVSLRCFAYVLLVLTPLYIGLSTAFGTVLYQSAYVVSAGFLSGTVPLALLMVAFVGLVVLFAASFVVELKVLGYQRSGRNFSVFHNTRSTAERFTVYTAFILVNFTFVIGVNAAYVYVALYESGSLLLAMQVLLSFFKLFWNKVCASYLVRAISSYISGFEVEAVEEYSREFMSIQLMISLFNNIAIPCLVVAVVSPDCFNSAFIAAPSIGAVFKFNDCTGGFDTTTNSCTYSLTSGSTTYAAPFTYNYQCSATFVTYYAPAFMYLCVTATFLNPSMTALLCSLYGRARQNTYVHRMLGYQLSRMLKLPTQAAPPPVEHNIFKPIFEASSAMTSVLTYIGLLLTFGAVFPPLGAALTITIVSTVTISRATVGRLICWASEGGYLSYLRVIELECREMTNPLLLRNALRLLVIIACWFHTLFLFDTLGDAVGFAGAYWVLIVMPLVPLCLYGVFMYYSRFARADSLRAASCVVEGVELSPAVPNVLFDESAQHNCNTESVENGVTMNVMLQNRSSEV